MRALSASRVREIYLIGRRGPVQAKFTRAELADLGRIPECDVVVDADTLRLDPASAAELEDRRHAEAAKIFSILCSFADRALTGAARRCVIRFFEAPIAFEGDKRVERIVLIKNRLAGGPFHRVAVPTGAASTLSCGLVFRSRGSRGRPLPGLPFDTKRGIIPNDGGRVLSSAGILPGAYVTGWIKRGATGVVGTNRADSAATIDAVLTALPALLSQMRPGRPALLSLLRRRCVSFVDFGRWLHIDAIEVARARSCGKPREKFTRVEEMLSVIIGPRTVRSGEQDQAGCEEPAVCESVPNVR